MRMGAPTAHAVLARKSLVSLRGDAEAISQSFGATTLRLPRSRWSLAMTQAWVADLAAKTFMRMGAPTAHAVFPRKRESKNVLDSGACPGPDPVSSPE
jgi:hypothetical protein